MLKKFAAMLTAIMMVVLSTSGALACTMIYVGSDLTEDGGVYFARSEDTSSQNKVYYVSPAGNHKAGETYTGCFGFTYTFTKDSYSYNAVRDDNLQGVCPDCGGTHDHTPYEEAGTNEKGVSVTATVTLGGNAAIREADPTVRSGGIEEAEIVTVLLSEASTAKEGLDLLMSIYDSVGAAGGSGIIIADQSETWYIENCTGTQYIAMKLPADMIFISPNMSAIGVIDLDDENVIASSKLIETAQAAGTFVGDAEVNVIDFRASYSNGSVNSRIVNGIHYLNAACEYTTDTLTDADFTISNVKDGEMTALYTNISVDHKITTKEMVDFYKVADIANTGNLEYHLFQIYADGAPETNIIEWLGMNHGAYGVMVPYYPMLTKDTYTAYQLSTKPASFVTEAPESNVPAYPTTKRSGEVGFTVLPENWADSYFWSFEAVSKYLINVDNAGEQTVLDTYAALQDEIYAAFADMKAAADASGDMAALANEMTAASAVLAQKAHETAVDLYNTISAK